MFNEKTYNITYIIYHNIYHITLHISYTMNIYHIPWTYIIYHNIYHNRIVFEEMTSLTAFQNEIRIWGILTFGHVIFVFGKKKLKFMKKKMFLKCNEACTLLCGNYSVTSAKMFRREFDNRILNTPWTV